MRSKFVDGVARTAPKIDRILRNVGEKCVERLLASAITYVCLLRGWANNTQIEKRTRDRIAGERSVLSPLLALPDIARSLFSVSACINLSGPCNGSAAALINLSRHLFGICHWRF